MTGAAVTTARLAELLRSEKVQPGAHLPAQLLADKLRVSRSPINEALSDLARRGIVERKDNRGYFLALPLERLPEDLRRVGAADRTQHVYSKVAEDRLSNVLPREFTEKLIRQKYGLTVAEVRSLLTRIAHEGWIEKRPGYGWEFSPMLHTTESLMQTYRMRLALEPAALLEPGYALQPAVLERCRAAETELLERGVDDLSAEELHARGVNFHESLAEGSRNPFFVDAIRRVNRLRRLISYRSMRDRSRYKQHCEQHLAVLTLIASGEMVPAANALRTHLESTVNNLRNISDVLQS